MIANNLITAAITLFVAASPTPQLQPMSSISAPQPRILASEEYSLTNRYKNTFVNDVFADNILLTLSYMSGQTKVGDTVNWESIHQPTEYHFVLQPGKTFAFHDQILEEYKDSLSQTTNADFSSDEGFKSDGWLVGDGVCHLASFINQVASEAGLQVEAPTNHNFAKIEDVDKKYGTAIYYIAGEKSMSSKQNLYVTNTTDRPIAFVFSHKPTSLEIAVEDLN
ncbi:hypothetical protein BH10PAT2_BH10PAT2_3850 [soil metagenome]